MDPELDPSSGADFIQARQRMAVTTAVTSLDADPDAAARALELSNATGVPAPVINSNLENFEQQHKASLTAQLLNNNEYLRTYINSNPMAAKVSNDDYARLDSISQKVSALHGLNLKSSTDAAVKAMAQPFSPPGFKEGFGEGPLGAWVLDQPGAAEHPEAARILGSVASPIELALRTLGGAATAIGYGIAGPEKGEQLSQAAMDPGLQATLEGIGPPGAMAASVLAALEKFRPAMPWARNARTTPAGVMPELDAARAKQNVEGIAALKDATSEAGQSLTRERSPELFNQFIAQHTDAEIAVSGDAATKLYGDKVPTSDDNLLGWVPGIEDKINLAKTTGADVAISLSDWLTHVSDNPEVFKALEDDIRMHPEGITANEAKLSKEADAASPPSVALPEDVPAVRAASALEPMLSIGDRKLELKRIAAAEGAKFGPDQGFHDFTLNDEKGTPVGTLNLSTSQGGKQLHVDMITGINGLGAKDFGPALMRDVLRQVKAEFPDAESVTGHRVTGAREKANSYMANSASPVIKLDNPKGWDTAEGDASWRRILEGGRWETYSPRTQAYIKPYAERSVEDRQMIGAVAEELDRIAPQKLQVQAADRISATSVTGQNRVVEPSGMYLQYKEAYPIILYSLEHGDPLGTARHEAIHHLFGYGFFKPEEWVALTRASKDNGWIEQFNIDRRYPNGSEGLKLEESIADAYKNWENGRSEAPPKVQGVFEKMKTFFDRIRQRIGEMLGKAEPTWEDIFKKVSTGEVGAREGTEPLDARAFNEKLSAKDEGTHTTNVDGLGADKWDFKDRDFLHKSDGSWKISDKTNGTYDLVDDEVGQRKLKAYRQRAFTEKLSVPDEGGSRVFERANALGMTVEQFKAYDQLMQKRHAEDVEAATKRASDQQAREHTQQWKSDRKALRVEVSENIKQRPDVAADLFFGSGELYGKKVPLSSVKMDAEALTPKQKAGLPRNYYGEHGVHPDDVANLFGYGSGDAMVKKLTEYNQAKLVAGGMSAKDFVSRVTDMETDRQMQIRHGVLENNIMDAVKEQVAGETQLNILHEETLKLGIETKQTVLDKASIIQGLRDQFAKMPVGSVSSDAYMRAAGKAGRNAELALLDNKPTEAFQAKQQQYYATVIAKEAIQLEKEQAKFDKLTKRFRQPFDPKSGATIDADFSLFIRQILSQVERPYGMSVQGLEKALGESGYKGLQDFVEQTERLYSIAGIEVPVADFLLDPAFHTKVEDLTVDQFRGLNQSVTALNTLGRDVQKVTINGEKANRTSWIGQATQMLRDKFAPQNFGATGEPGAIRHYIAALTNLETLFARFDGRNPNGVFTTMFTYPAARAANYKDVLLKEFSKDYDAVGPIAGAKRKVDSPLIDPLTKQPLTDFNRESIATIISNMGNEYNWRVFTKGWGVDPDTLWKWVEANSTPEDFARAQAVGKIFSKGKDLSDTVYKNIYGISPESIQVRPFTAHGQTYEGWYHPIIYDPIRSKLSKLQSDDPSGAAHSNFWPSTSNAYTKRRTGAVDVISLSQDMVPIKLNQMLHDVAFREFVHNTAKITRDDAFRRGVTERYGPEYVGTIDTWLNRIAGNASFNSDAVALATRMSSKLRSNVVSTYIAFSATTIEKHGFTAAVMSSKEVGAGKFTRITAEVAADSFKHAVSDLFGKSPGLGESLWQFTKRNSEEIQRRDRNFQETLGGQHDMTMGRSTLRSRIMELGSKGVAFSDMLSAVPLWLAKYREVIDETGDAGHATDLADRAVRRAHGSTAITNQPTIVSNTGALAPWLTTIYGFFGTNMQRRFEIAHDLNDAYKLGMGGNISGAAKMAPGIMSSIFTYVIWPGLVEEAVTSQFYDDKSKGGVLGHALAFTLGTAASTFIGIRDLAYGLMHNREPQVGLISSPLHDAEQLLRDVKKRSPMGKQNAGKLVEDAITVFGDASGMGPKHIGTIARYGIDVLTKQQKPKTAGDIYRGVISGKQEKTKVQ